MWVKLDYFNHKSTLIHICFITNTKLHFVAMEYESVSLKQIYWRNCKFKYYPLFYLIPTRRGCDEQTSVIAFNTDSSFISLCPQIFANK
mgnify:CR=1 FL=1